MKNCFFPHVSSEERKLPFYLYCSAWEYDQEEVDRQEGCPWFQLNICRSGRGVLHINGTEQEIREGDSMVIFPGIPHHYRAAGGKMMVSWIAFDGFQTGGTLKSMGIETSGIYRLNNNGEIHESIKRTLELQHQEMTEQGFRGSEMVYSFLMTVRKGYSPGEGGSKKQESREKIRPAIDFMEKHLSDPIGIEEISGSVGITPQHFCLLFKSAFNQRPFEYLNNLRLNHSKNMLIDKLELPLKEVSRLSGYPSHSYYCMLFRKQERLTPAEFRKLYRNDSSIVRRGDVDYI